MFELDAERIMFLGDTHGDIKAVSTAVQRAVELCLPYIIQVGDFGFWPHTPEGKRFLEETTSILKRSSVQLLFIDGNHENFDALYKLPVDRNGLREVTSYITHISRGVRAQIGDYTFGFLGGAVSIDRKFRVLGESWWRQEEILAEDVEKLGDDKLDVLVTHDAPFLALTGFPMLLEADGSREQLSKAVRCTLPDLIIHGHFHKSYIGKAPVAIGVDGDLSWHEVKVIGLADNDAKEPENRLLLNTVERKEL